MSLIKVIPNWFRECSPTFFYTLDIDISITEQTRTAIIATFSNVPTEELEELANGVSEVFNRIVGSEGIDMNRMKTVLRLERLRVGYHSKFIQGFFYISC